MKTKITLITASAILWISSTLAQSVPIVTKNCSDDLNGFVNYKNTVNGTGSYQLKNGFEEKASQTYNYLGPGKITSIRISGSNPSIFFLAGVPLKIGVYNVDASGKPTTLIASTNKIWWSYPNNNNGYMDVTFPGGVAVNNRFALSTEILNEFPFGNEFNLKYTGNGEGGGQDLASLAGSSTGNNWTSAKNSFGKDGDFYIVPNMAHVNDAKFTTLASCYAINSPILFTNKSELTKDSMFNKIALTNYVGTNKFYEWNFGDGSPISNLKSPIHTYTMGGLYNVTLTTKIEGWQDTCIRVFSSDISIGLTVNTTSIVNVTCHRGNDGSFVAIAQYGAPTYSYKLNDGLWQSSPIFTGLRAGTYTLYVKDIKGCTNTTAVTITHPAGISFNSLLTTNASCGTATGALSANAFGGIAPLTYQLDLGSFQSNGNFSNLAVGTHTLNVKDANACMNSTVILINSLTGPTLNTPNFTNVSCYGGTDGSISLSSTGGTGLIQYSINGGNTYQTSGNFTALAAGLYLCVVKDNAGCKNYSLVTISAGPSLEISAETMPALCYGSNSGQIMASSTGGTGIRNYSLNGINYQSSPNFNGLYAGIYTIYVKDITSCIKTTTINVTEPSSITNSLTSIAATCNGLQNGSITSIATGGNGDYTYSINGTNFQSDGFFKNLPAATYTVFVHDANFCNYSSVITVSQPSPITTTVNTTNSTCTFTNGSIMVIAAGGSGSGYQYSIDGINYFPSGLFTSLEAGIRYVIAKDGTGCTTVVSGVIVSAGGPTITASTSQNVSCHDGSDGSITISGVAGGTGLIEYSKDGVNFQTSNVLTGLQAGIYIVQIKDANGCIGSVTKTITEPNPYLIAFTTQSVTCNGSATGSATITASGGAGFLAYSINTGMSYQSGTIFNNLTVGDYIIMVKDAANCIGYSEFSIVQPKAITVSVAVLNVTCHGANNGAISITATDAPSPYLYSIDGVNYSSTNSFANLSGNTNYVVYVKDGNNCITLQNSFVNEPTLMNIASIVNNVTCAGGNNGVINLNVTGGVTPYTYQWTNSTTSSSNVNLNPGNYAVVVTDNNGCTATRGYTITQPTSPLIINGLVTSASSNSSTDGSIDATTTGGTSPYNFSWSNGGTTEDITGLNPGAYLLTITDANGCSSANTFIVGNLTGVEDLKINLSDVRVYPNPANDYVVIDASGHKIDKVELINLLGQTIINQEGNDTILKINVSAISNGTYFIKVYSGKNNVVTKKITINK